MCTDQIVEATIRFQLLHCQPQVVFSGVRQLWMDLWTLTRVHREATSLLHAQLFNTKQQGVPALTHLGYVVKIFNIFPPILTLLAAGATELLLNPSVMVVPSVPLSSLAETGIFNEYNNLVKINTDIVDFGRHTEFFVHLLPCCHRLTTLIIEYNVTPEILMAARHCPLQVLGIDKSNVVHPEVIFEVLVQIMLGISHARLKRVFNAYKRGKPVPLNPTWPNLMELNTQSIVVSQEFLSLVLVAHPNLQFLESDVVPMMDIIKLHVRILEKLPGHPKLSLKGMVAQFGEIQELYPYYPKLQQVSLVIPAGMEGTVEDLLRLGCHLPNFTHLRLTYNGFANPRRVPKTNQFQEFMHQITALELATTSEGHLEACWVVALLRQFPGLKNLHLNDNHISNTESGIPWVNNFNTVIHLQTLCKDINLTMNFLRMFPSLKQLTLTFFPDIAIFPWECLEHLEKLRILQVLAYKMNNILDLCNVPRQTPDDEPWILGVPVRHMPKWVARKLQCAGWTWRSLSDMQLYQYSTHIRRSYVV